MSQIITSSDLAAYMKKTLDTNQAADVVAGVNQWIENETKRVWGATSTFTERYDWAPIIWLRHADVASITSVKLGYPGQPQTLVTTDSYLFNSRGRLTMYLARAFNPSVANNDLVEVVYVSGVATVPDDLKMAALAIAAGMYNFAANDQKEVTLAMVGQYRLQFSETGADKYFNIVKSYKLRKV